MGERRRDGERSTARSRQKARYRADMDYPRQNAVSIARPAGAQDLARRSWLPPLRFRCARAGARCSRPCGLAAS